MNLTSNAEHSLSFHCRSTDCSEQSHPATEIAKDEDGTFFLLCKNPGGRETSDLPQGSSVWFESEQHSQEYKSDACSTKPINRALETLSDDDLDEDNVSNEVICLLINFGCIVIFLFCFCRTFRKKNFSQEILQTKQKSMVGTTF